MADPRFYRVAGPFTLGEIARIADAEILAGADPERIFTDVAPLSTANRNEVSFLDNRAYTEAFSHSRAGACIVARELAAAAPAGMALLVSSAPYRAYALVAQAFYPGEPPPGHGVSPGAFVDPSAHLSSDVTVAPGAVIGAGAEIGGGSRIGANTVIGPGVKLGANCAIGPCVSIHYTVAGDRLRVYAGVRIGEDGFGYASDRSGHTKIPQLGRVVIGHDVEIGANSSIDRGSGPDTVIGDGCIIDNLVQIGHNVRLGKRCIIVSQVGISGSTTVLDGAVIGGQVGIAGHITIGEGARIGAQAGVVSDVPAGVTLLGSPAQPVREFWRQIAVLKRLAGKKGE